MIRPLRQWHRRIVCSLGVLLPVAFAVGLLARRQVPIAANIPSELSGLASDAGEVVWTKADLWPDQHITTSLRRDSPGCLSVGFMFQDIAKPDVLVYWAAGRMPAGEGLPDNARLIGALSNRVSLHFPADARGELGQFLLYSLADHEVVAISQSLVIVKG